jgi:hypothetical protein
MPMTESWMPSPTLFVSQQRQPYLHIFWHYVTRTIIFFQFILKYYLVDLRLFEERAKIIIFDFALLIARYHGTHFL